jgi:hypothetical protein
MDFVVLFQYSFIGQVKVFRAVEGSGSGRPVDVQQTF